MYYVYALIDVRTNLPFYIGKGLKVNNRHLDHFNESIGTTSNRHKMFKINFLRSSGYEIPIDILADNIPNEEDAYNIETGYIKKYGRTNIDPDGILTNICLGNRPPNHSGRKQTQEHTAKRVKSYMETCKKVGRKPHSEETKKKIARPGKLNPFYGKEHSLEFKQAHSNRMKGNKNNGKKYIFTSPEGTEYIVIGEFYKFCNDNNLIISTMERALQHNRMPLKGKCSGWTVKRSEKND
jgi:hypothetical protein